MLGTPQFCRLCLVGRRLCSVLTLLACVVTSVGLPIGQSLGDPSSYCRCDEGLKVAGQCCCTKAKSSGSSKSCCAKTLQKTPSKNCQEKGVTRGSSGQSLTETRSRRSVKFCCESKPRSGCEASPESEDQFVSACSCGGPSNSQICVNAEPRILLTAVEVPKIDDGHRHSPLSDPCPPRRSVAPETPPPQVRPSRLSPV